MQAKMTTWTNKLEALIALLRLDKPAGSILLLWPTLTALWLASGGYPTSLHLFIFVVGVFVTRSLGCIINDICDRNFDGHVARTARRPLASGAMTLFQALMVLIVLMIIALLLVLQLNALSFYIALAGVALMSVYPLMKRIMPIPQLILGFVFNLGILIAFAATQNTVPLIAWYYYFIMILWTLLYDTFYAMADKQDDLKLGLHSSAILFGQYDKFITGILQFIIVVMLFGLQWLTSLNGYFSTMVVNVIVLFMWQQYLIKDRDPKLCFQAFLNHQWALWLVFFGVMLTLLR